MCFHPEMLGSLLSAAFFPPLFLLRGESTHSFLGVGGVLSAPLAVRRMRRAGSSDQPHRNSTGGRGSVWMPALLEATLVSHTPATHLTGSSHPEGLAGGVR